MIPSNEDLEFLEQKAKEKGIKPRDPKWKDKILKKNKIEQSMAGHKINDIQGSQTNIQLSLRSMAQVMNDMNKKMADIHQILRDVTKK